MNSRYFFLLSAVCCLLFLHGCGNSSSEEGTPSAGAEATDPSVALSDSVSQQESQESDDVEATILVTVDGKPLTRGMARGMAREIAARQGVPPQMAQQFIAQMGPQLEQQAVEQFINDTLVQKEAVRLEIPVSAQEIDDVLSRLTESLPEGVSIDQVLAAQSMTVADLRQEIESNERVRKLYRSKTDSAGQATDAEVQTFYEENREQFTNKEEVSASHILIATDETASAEDDAKAKAEAEDVLAQLKKGSDFAELAMAKSDCPSKERGGDLGSFGRGQMVPSFEEAAFSQPIGEIGSIVKTQFGYHIIRVTGRTDASVRSLKEASDEIREHLEMQAREKLFEGFLNELREDAEITFGDGTSG